MQGFFFLAVVTPSMAELLTEAEIVEQLPEGWRYEGDEIVRVFHFDDYLRGMAFAVEVAEIADEEFHHPEITVGHEGVEVRLTSHEAGGITDKDVFMAELFDEAR